MTTYKVNLVPYLKTDQFCKNVNYKSMSNLWFNHYYFLGTVILITIYY